MVIKARKKKRRVVVYRPQVLDSELGKSDGAYRSRSGEVGAHPVLDVLEDILTIITAALLLALILELSALSGQTQSTDPAHTIALRPVVARLFGNQTFIGARHTHAVSVHKKPDTRQQLAWDCSAHTIMNIVAHQDDDLLFINPAISQDVQQRYCVRTVYVTAGDDGRGANYLLSREAGSEAAYNVMLGITRPWKYQKLQLVSGATVTVANPEGDSHISLIFLRLPDGNLNGSGFFSTGYESIAKLYQNTIPTIKSIDGQSTYTSSGLTDSLAALMEYYMPIQINTQSDDVGFLVADHSDHIATGQYVSKAASIYASYRHAANTNLVRYFMGYPIRSMSTDLTVADMAEKAAAFFAYAVHDPGVCTSIEQCLTTHSTYGLYLGRQYVSDQ